MWQTRSIDSTICVVMYTYCEILSRQLTEEITPLGGGGGGGGELSNFRQMNNNYRPVFPNFSLTWFIRLMTIASCISPWRPSRSTIHAFRNSEITTIVLFRDVMKEPKRFNLCGKVETLYLHPLIDLYTGMIRKDFSLRCLK